MMNVILHGEYGGPVRDIKLMFIQQFLRTMILQILNQQYMYIPIAIVIRL